MRIVDVTSDAIPIPPHSFPSVVFPATTEKLRMSDTPIADFDLAKELRLRRWARKNYVSAENRSAKWHPVVLDEMRKRDLELKHRQAGQTICSTFVPLPPTEFRRFDEAHKSVGEPNLLHADSREPLPLLYESRG